MTAPPEDFVPEQARGEPACGLIVVYVGDPSRGEEALRPLLDWGEPLVTAVGPMPYTAVQQLTDPAHPWGICEYPKIDYLSELPDEAIAALIEKAGAARSPFTQLLLCRLGGAVGRMDRSSMALNMPDAGWAYFALAAWWDRSGEDDHIAWARDVMDTMRQWATDTAPPNFIAADEGPARLRRFYGDDKFERLVALKDEYDPLNVFALNQNIPPTP
jgi:FAD/FMN-containing dehydrogenase